MINLIKIVGNYTGKMVLACWLHRRRAPPREKGDCPFSPHLAATQLSLSPCVSDTFRVTGPLLEPRETLFIAGFEETSCHGVSCHMERALWQRTQKWLTANKKLRPSVQPPERTGVASDHVT